MLLKQLYIDVNDPRNEQIIKMLKETKNEFLVKLMSDDAKNVLADIEPFRHKLLQNRTKDPLNSNVFIPFLEGELIDSTRTGFYLEQLEKLFRDEAYLKHLEKRAQLQSDGTTVTQVDDLAVVDIETLRRRQAIYDQIKDRSNRKGKESSAGTSQYRSIVREVEIDVTNPFVGIFNRFFVNGRRLKPIVKKREVVAFENVKECKLFVHIIKGENVPIRKDFLTELRDVNNQGNRKRTIEQNRMRRPTPNAPADARGGLGNVQDGDDNGDLEEVPPTMIIKNKTDLYNTAQVETFVEVRV